MYCAAGWIVGSSGAAYGPGIIVSTVARSVFNSANNDAIYPCYSVTAVATSYN